MAVGPLAANQPSQIWRPKILYGRAASLGRWTTTDLTIIGGVTLEYFENQWCKASLSLHPLLRAVSQLSLRIKLLISDSEYLCAYYLVFATNREKLSLSNCSWSCNVSKLKNLVILGIFFVELKLKIFFL